jgi:phosphorylcholine metabolism protein LicD
MSKKNELLDQEIFFKVIEILNASNVKWWIDHGTLLGYIRDGGPIEWDRDFDLGTSASVEELIETVFPNIARTFNHAYIDSLADALKIQFFNTRGVSWSIDIASYEITTSEANKYWPNLVHARWHKKALSVAISAMCGRKADKLDKLVVRMISAMIRPISLLLRRFVTTSKRHKILKRLGKKLPYSKNSIDPIYFSRIDSMEIDQKAINIPSPHESYLEARYGETWKVPRKQWNYIIDDGGNKNTSKA